MPESPEVRARSIARARIRRETAGPGGVDEGIFTTAAENRAVARAGRANLAAGIAAMDRMAARNMRTAGNRNVNQQEFRAINRAARINRNAAASVARRGAPAAPAVAITRRPAMTRGQMARALAAQAGGRVGQAAGTLARRGGAAAAGLARRGGAAALSRAQQDIAITRNAVGGAVGALTTGQRPANFRAGLGQLVTRARQDIEFLRNQRRANRRGLPGG